MSGVLFIVTAKYTEYPKGAACMSWLLSFIIFSLFYTSLGSFADFSYGNLSIGNSPQLAILTPQSVLQGDETERFEKTYPLSSNGRVSVSNVNGSIEVEGWDRNEVKLEVVKITDSKERLSQVEVKIEDKPDFFKVETNYGVWRNGSRNWNCSGSCRLEIKYKLMVPRNAVLNGIETVNGSVTISNTTNVTKASAVNGTVKASGLRGTADIDTVNGVSEISFDKLDSNSQINLSTVNGRVNLVIPSDADATIKADTVNGNISNEFNLPVRKGKYVGRNLFGKIGEGTSKINLDSVNGGLSIRRLQDGKNVKPVVNLLSKEDDSASNVTNREIDRSVREANRIAAEETRKAAQITREQMAISRREMAKSQQETAKAMKEASKEMAKSNQAFVISQRELAKINEEVMKATQIGLNAAFGFSNSGNFRVEEKSETFQVKGTPKLTVNAKDCAVSVRGWDRNEIKYRLVKHVQVPGHPGMGISVNHSSSNTSDSEVTINAAYEKIASSKSTVNGGVSVGVPQVFIPGDSVRLEVYVPKKSNLRILTDKEIRIDGVSGNIDLTGNEGAINVRDSQGQLKISSAISTVRVIGFTGDIDSKTIDGTSFFEGTFNKFRARSEAGVIVLTLPDNANANLDATSTISLEGFSYAMNSGDSNRIKLGSGGNTYYLNAEEGQIFVRSDKLLVAGN